MFKGPSLLPISPPISSDEIYVSGHSACIPFLKIFETARCLTNTGVGVQQQAAVEAIIAF